MKHMKMIMILLLCFSLTVSGCKKKDDPEKPEEIKQEENRKEDEEIMVKLIMKIDDQIVKVNWEDNESVSALKKLCEDEVLLINTSLYGGFEQVGSIGQDLPRNDSDMTTSPGDIVLYSGDQLVVFFGSNSWAYTRLGRIGGLSNDELRDLLNKDQVTIELFQENEGQ